MYEYLPIILGCAMLSMGAFMYFKPEQSVKKEMRDSKEAVQKIKKNGRLVFLCGVVAVVVGIFLKLI